MLNPFDLPCLNDTEFKQALGLIHNKAIKHSLTIATAESITGGRVAAALTTLPGSSLYFRGGIVAYHIDAKEHLLRVRRHEAAACNCVSDRIANQMAFGAKEQFGADCIIATTGYAEPWPAGGIPAPFAHYTVLCQGNIIAGRVPLDGLDRKGAQEAMTRSVVYVLAAMMNSTL